MTLLLLELYKPNTNKTYVTYMVKKMRHCLILIAQKID